jgi:hypothetical protein
LTALVEQHQLLFCNAGRGGGLATCGVNASGGLGRGFATAPGAGLTSIGGGNGATCCWLVTGAGEPGAGALVTGGAAGGRGATAFGLAGGRRGLRPGIGTCVSGSLGGVTCGGGWASTGGGSEIGAGIGGGGSPRSIASSLFVS